jgi:hypothetical protein
VIIASLADVKYAAAREWESAAERESEIAPSLVLEHIEIFNPTIEIDRESSCRYIRESLILKRPAIPHRLRSLLVRAESIGMLGPQLGREEKLRLIGRLDDRNSGPTYNIDGRRLAGVLPKKVDSRLIKSWWLGGVRLAPSQSTML